MAAHNDEYLTALAEAAVALHELYTQYVVAGFTESQALYLVATIFTPNRGYNV